MSDRLSNDEITRRLRNATGTELDELLDLQDARAERDTLHGTTLVKNATLISVREQIDVERAARGIDPRSMAGMF